jgi:tetratricopeptide (TPR) repeat protein
LWGPSKNFQHLEAIAELRRALTLQPNLPHAHNRMGAILVHIGLLEQARGLYEQGRRFEPRGAMSHGITQVYLYAGEYDLARNQIELWRTESPDSKNPVCLGSLCALLQGDWAEARTTLKDGIRRWPQEPWLISLQGLLYALTGQGNRAVRCARRACESPKSFGHAHHTYYQIACIHAVLRRTQAAMEWLEKAIDTGWACWPFFRQDPCLQNIQELPEFKALINSLEAQYGQLNPT